MLKYWGKQIFAHGRFPEVGQKQKTEKKREREKERLNDDNNNGQATHGARKPPGPKTKSEDHLEVPALAPTFQSSFTSGPQGDIS